MAREQITFRLPGHVLLAARARADRDDMTLTGVVELALRREVGMEKITNGPVGFQPGLVDSPTRDEFDALDERVRKIERVAENQGAL